MKTLARREFLLAAAASASALAARGQAPLATRVATKKDVHQQLLELAEHQQSERRARFAAIRTPAELTALQASLRENFLRLIGGLPAGNGPPPANATRAIEAEGYSIEKLVYESFPGYFVPALLYRPKATGPRPAVISPCGHSTVGKAADAYQQLHINLAQRGFFVLTYDPVGQGERSQFWDAERKRSKYNLTCGEHAVLGNPLYLLGMSLARYRIWDGMRAIDYLASLPDVDSRRIGCVGNSGGGTLTAYISALDPRVAAAAICCYITTLPRRMGNRIEKDPDADPEQDINGFVAAGIDHAGLLALRAPRPTLVGAALEDFFPIEGARESFAEGQHLFEVAGAKEKIAMAEAPGRHGLSLTLRTAALRFFDRWLAGGKGDESIVEAAVQPRKPDELLVTPGGQVNVWLKSRPLLSLALEQFQQQPAAAKLPLNEIVRPATSGGDYRLTEIAPGREGNRTLLLCVNGNEATAWQEEKEFLAALTARGCAVSIVEPRGVGALRPAEFAADRNYTNPLAGAEENLAYNAFLVGQSLLSMRVADVLAAAAELAQRTKLPRVVLVGRRDAALVALFAAALEPSLHGVAAETAPLSYLPLFDPAGTAINAASILPGLVQSFGDLPQVIAEIAPRPCLLAASTTAPPDRLSATLEKEPFSQSPQLLLNWLERK